MGKIRANQIDMDALKKLAYPVGSVYINIISSDNPSSLLGFGTWSEISGRVLVGQDTGDTAFDTLGETGGAKTHTVTENEMPVHTHTQNSHNHSQNSHYHNYNHTHEVRYKGFTSIAYSTNGWNILVRYNEGYDSSNANALDGGAGNTNSPTATNNATTATNNNTGGGLAHNNVQPYEVAKIWKRTA